jgi:hypothetical protein
MLPNLPTRTQASILRRQMRMSGAARKQQNRDGPIFANSL